VNKKKQKNFIHLRPRQESLARAQGQKSFLVLFFKKEPLPYAAATCRGR
jgi:hypothetical protein